MVDTDATASKVLDIMLKEKTGRVTFMPLNRLKPKNPPMPTGSDAEPLLGKLVYEDRFEKAFSQVFGKTCVCRDLGVAAAYVKSHGINTITLDGDKVDRKGALTGGYHDVRRSRIEGIKGVGVWRAKFEAESKRSGEVKAEIVRVEQEITQMNGRVAVLEGQMKQVREAREGLIAQGTGLAREKERVGERIGRMEVDVEELEREIGGLEGKVGALSAELRTPLANGITPKEEEMIGTLQNEVEERRKGLGELSRRKNEVCPDLLAFCSEFELTVMHDSLKRRRMLWRLS